MRTFAIGALIGCVIALCIEFPVYGTVKNLKKQVVEAELDYQEIKMRIGWIDSRQEKIINKMYTIHRENEQIKKILELSGANQRGLQIQIDKLIEILSVQEYQIDILTEGAVR